MGRVCVFCIRQVSSGRPGESLWLSPPLSRRQCWASEHLFVSGCEIIVIRGQESFISLVCDPVLKCDIGDKRQTGVTAPVIPSLPSPGLSFFQTE